MSILAFIGGTGFDLSGPNSPFEGARDQSIATRFGPAHVTRARLDGREVVFLHRHARPDQPQRRDVPPHRINYRANIAALKSLDVAAILASTAVGSLRATWTPGTLVCPDGLLDFTSNREATFFDERAIHVDVTRPYCPVLRDLVLDVARERGLPLQNGATYACTNGPRFETAAEIRAFLGWGVDLAGMTACPEAFLAREAEISYAGVSIATNLAAGISPHPLNHLEVLEAMNEALPRLADLFLECARRWSDDPMCPARRATREFAGPGYDPLSAILGDGAAE